MPSNAAAGQRELEFPFQTAHDPLGRRGLVGGFQSRVRRELERNWSLLTLGGSSVAVPNTRTRPSLSFDSKASRVSGMAGVNRFNGPYVVSAGSLRLGPLVATKMAGAPELNELETRFLRALERATEWRIDRGELELLNGDDVLARFASQM